MNKKKILAVTGARSEYDLLYELYRALDRDEAFDFKIVITGPHLSEKYGATAALIKKDGFVIADEIYSLIDTDKRQGRVISLAHQIPGFAQTFQRENPDLVLVAGDREECISVSVTCAYMDIACAHFFGGDIAKDGNIDNTVRYATSKLSHLHFPTLQEHKNTLLKLGEDDFRINVVGNPAIDRLLQINKISKIELAQKLGSELVNQDYVVLIQHSIITEVNQQARNIRITLEAIKESGVNCIVNYPNSDSGNHAIIEAYQEYFRDYPDQFFLFQNLDRLTYVNLLRHAISLIGNSSSGLLEAPSLGLPAINIGSRQRGRVHGSNVIFVNHDHQEILDALNKVQKDHKFLTDVSKKENPYGDGHAVEKIMSVLKNTDFTDPNLIYKNITY